MKILLIGANGQLGSDLRKELASHVVFSSARVNIYQTQQNETAVRLDIANITDIKAFFEQTRPDIVINTSAFHRVDEIERDASQALAINANAVHQLALVCRQFDVDLLHISTDYVYDGAQNTPYAESDLPNPLSAYGASKLVGEHLIRSAWQKHYIIRTCGLYGLAGASGKGGNFVNTMLRLANEGKEIKVVCDQICTPTFTSDLAKQIALLIETKAYGLYHCTNDGACSWYEFAVEIFHLAKLNPSLKPILSAEFNAPAQRPPYSVLKNAKLSHLNIDRMRHWHDALGDYIHQKTKM
jgi:dTDP-4-dehydrorhamnose reductase